MALAMNGDDAAVDTNSLVGFGSGGGLSVNVEIVGSRAVQRNGQISKEPAGF